MQIETRDVSMTSTYGGVEATINGYLASSAGSHASLPGIIIVHEIFGVTPHIQDVARRFAQEGYHALAINLFSREGEPPSLAGGFEPLREFVSRISDAQISADLGSAATFLKSLPGSSGTVGLVGYCWGGRVAMLQSAQLRELNACVAYYGRITGQQTPNQPVHPMDVVQNMTVPLQGHFGAEDGAIPAVQAVELQAALAALGRASEIYVYDGAGHAFNNDTREMYHAQAAGLAWSRTLQWFARYL